MEPKYFAQLDKNNVVMQVIVASQEFISNLPGNWVETDINGVSPKNYAGIDYSFDASRNAFIPPKQFNSWQLNEDTCQWEPPIPYPNDGKLYFWNEDKLNWEIIEISE